MKTKLATLRCFTPLPMFFIKLSCLASFFSLLLSADTVVLTTGDSMEGHLLSTDEHSVRLRDARGIIQEIQREKVSTIRLSTPVAETGSAQASERVAAGPPEQQQRFCDLVARFREEATAYMQETNPIRKAGMASPDPYRYESQVRTLFGPEHKFLNWTGTLRFGTSGHSVGIVFTPSCDPPNPAIQFANAIEQAGFAVQDRASVIHADSPIAHTLAAAKAGDQPATVSGSWLPISGLARFNQALGGTPNTGNGRALFRSQTNPSGASVAQPNYLVQFTSVNLADANTQTLGRQR